MISNIRPMIEHAPVRWRILDQWTPEYARVAGGIYVEERRNRDGNTRYAVVLRDHWELSRDMSWDSMPIPSERTDGYLLDHRWDQIQDAIAMAEMAAEAMLEEVEDNPASFVGR